MRWYIFLSAIVILTLSACDVEEVPVLVKEKYIGTVRTEFVTHQIISFYPGAMEENPDDSLITFEGELGGVPISAGKTGDVVIFVVPNLPAGTQQLKLKIGYEFRIWDVTVVDKPFEIADISGFWNEYFSGSDVINDSLKTDFRLKFYAQEAEKWTGYFKSKLSQLSPSEKNELIYIIYRNDFYKLIPYYFKVEGAFENCLEAQFAVYSKNSFDEGDSQRKLKSNMVYLPSSGINDALLAFIGDLIWRHNGIIEFLAQKVFSCPILRDVLLETKWGPVGIDPIIFNSGDTLGFKLTGVYSRLNEFDRSLYLDPNRLGFIASYFDIDKFQKLADQKFLYALNEKKKLDLPPISSAQHYFYLGNQKEEKPLIDYSFEVEAISNPDVIVSQTSQQGDQVLLTFERKKTELQDFQFTLNFVQSGFSVSRFIKGTMAKTSELILDLSFDSGTANLQILSGELPYQIEWSNGVTEQKQVKFNAGNYSVKVTDGNGSEELMDFSIPEFGTVQDREGNEYQTVKIGNQWWMAENLRNITRKDGKLIQEREYWPSPNPYNPIDFDYASFSYYDNDPENDKEYGKLYNFHSYVGCLCPEGWGIPTFQDFTNMANELGGLSVAGKKLKSRSTWKESIFNSTNESGFNAKPGGMKINNNIYESENIFVGWWVIGPNVPNRIASLDVGNNELKLTTRGSFFFEGHYIRCIKKVEDEPSC
ncbi:fibrobacter succinogenes major paralogous domain-containing protein [Aquiflexum sp. TKW24L]|uniref:fibrobacter succinogenes major paralogous domain-containing protein n=1 Tax=Aquiflexum sp. TKW24L TaxID=2942212 RepID=UPI0020BDF648|nr:fibrobacter succinogenes major paralogous domain-containing protein [Aquiflexum sp. TKW24L]MCL6261730.1 fibrobacter succinogenes major paralogous domain-containing protein [Aquiflexum sp. TKW24L]